MPNNSDSGDSWWKKASEEISNKEERNQRLTKFLEECRVLRTPAEEVKRMVKTFYMEEELAKAITHEFSEVLALLDDDETVFLCMNNELTNYDVILHCVQCGRSMRDNNCISYCPSCGRKVVFLSTLKKREKEKPCKKGAAQ